jgi:hypothetical protein
VVEKGQTLWPVDITIWCTPFEALIATILRSYISQVLMAGYLRRLKRRYDIKLGCCRLSIFTSDYENKEHICHYYGKSRFCFELNN